MFSIFPLDLVATPQVLPLAGGISGSVNVYLQFTTAPSAGTVTLEYRRPGSATWTALQGMQAASVTTGSIIARIDGGVSALRVTFAGLTGGVLPVLATSECETATPPSDLLSDGGFGASRRVRVDPGQTGFFAGRFFRSYLEFVMPTAGPERSFRFTSPIDFILWIQDLVITQGAIRYEVFVTPTTQPGPWTPLPIIGVNRMASRPAPFYTPQVTIDVSSTAGAFTGGTPLDLLMIRTASTNGQSSNVGLDNTERGLPAGVYYGRISTLTGGLTVNDAAQGKIALQWEERPVIS